MHRDARGILWDIAQAGEDIAVFTAGLDAETFLGNRLVRQQCSLWPSEASSSLDSGLPRVSSRRFRLWVCGFDVRSGGPLGWNRDLGAREAVDCLFFVLIRARYRWQVKSGFRRYDARFGVKTLGLPSGLRCLAWILGNS